MERYRWCSGGALLVLVVGCLPRVGLAHYDPQVGRFLQRDPYERRAPASSDEENWRHGWRPWPAPAAQYSDGMSLYEYGRSSPPVHTDPLGLFTDVNGQECNIRTCRRHAPPPWPPHTWIDLGIGVDVHFPTHIDGDPVSTEDNGWFTSCDSVFPARSGPNSTLPSGKKTKCATCSEVRWCLKRVMDWWNSAMDLQWWAHNCIAAKNDALRKCGLASFGLTGPRPPLVPSPRLPRPPIHMNPYPPGYGW